MKLREPASRSLARRLGRRLFRSQEARAEFARRHPRLTTWPPVGLVRFGSLRRGLPISRSFGFNRGTPIDRYYIKDFFQRHSVNSLSRQAVIRGAVLEMGQPTYTSAFGSKREIQQLDILDVSSENPRATIVADLAEEGNLSPHTYDCIICTQTLPFIYDFHTAIRTLHRILKPGGTLLVSLPGISQVAHPEAEQFGDYWRFTTMSAQRLFEDVFDGGDVTVESYGNVLTATAFLHGLAAEDLRPRELALQDPDYQVTIGVKAVKAVTDRPAQASSAHPTSLG